MKHVSAKCRIASRLAALLMFITVSVSNAGAQQLWLNAEARAPITKALRASVELEHRSRDGFGATSRWSAAAALSYKVAPWLRASASYKFIYGREAAHTTRKGNFIPAYWEKAHRFQLGLTGSLRLGKFGLSLREAYQMTHTPGFSVEKWGANGFRKDDEVIAASTRHLLRSRLQAEYKHCKKALLTPFASIEVYNDFSDGFSLRKMRYTIGTDIRINKRNSLSAFYRFVDRRNSDNTNVIGVGYSFKL